MYERLAHKMLLKLTPNGTIYSTTNKAFGFKNVLKVCIFYLWNENFFDSKFKMCLLHYLKIGRMVKICSSWLNSFFIWRFEANFNWSSIDKLDVLTNQWSITLWSCSSFNKYFHFKPTFDHLFTFFALIVKQSVEERYSLTTDTCCKYNSKDAWKCG